MENKFNVVYGGLQQGVTAEEFIASFCQKFGISEQKAEKIVAADAEVIVKKDLSEAKAGKYAAAFESCGMVVRLVEINVKPEAEAEAEKPSGGLSLEPIDGEDTGSESEAAEVAPRKCPKCGSTDIDGDECLACGIYISKYLENQKNIDFTEASDSQINTDVDTNDNASDNWGETEETDNNPYAAPEATLEKNNVSKEGQGSLQGGINGDYDFTIGDIFSEAWEKTRGAKGTFLLAWFFYCVIAIAINMLFNAIGQDPQILMQQGRMSEGLIWAIAPSLLTIPLLYPVLAGIVLLGIHRAVGADIHATSVFSHYGKIIPLTILTIVSGFLIMLGMMLLIIPGIYLAVGYMMAMALVIDRDMGVWEALESSRKAISKHWFKVFFLYFLLWLLIMVSAVPVLLGLIWTLPLASILHGVLYKHMFGVESVE